MKAKTELLLYECLWAADIALNPTWTNLNSSFEHWCSRSGLLRHIHRLEARGFLESRAAGDGMERLVRLTQQGVLRALGGCDPMQRWNRGWDGKWRMVVFDLPERRRDLRKALRRQLRDARFGGLQRSVWISPDPVDDIRAALNKSEAVCGVIFLFQGSVCGGEHPEQMVKAAWNFDAVQSHYANYRAYLQTLVQFRGDQTREELHAWRTGEHSLWLECMEIDPLLPRELWPPGYGGESAWEAKRQAMRMLAQLSGQGTAKS